MELRLIIMALICLCIAQLAFASDLEQERFVKLTKEVRCSICQNQSLFESNSPFASDLRVQIRNMLNLDYTDQQIKDYLRKQYGDYVLFSPPFRAQTLLLWFGPLLMLAIALVFFERMFTP